MKTKKILAILCSIVMFCNIQVFAQEQYTTWQYTQPPQYVTKEVEVRNGTISFTTRCEKHRIDCRCSPELDISIKESNVGILQDGDILYFETSKYHDKYFKSVAYEFVTKGITVKEVKLPEENENCFAMRISRTNKNELAQIDVRLAVDLRGENYREEYFIPFSLYLDTDKTKEHNLFSEEKNILLNEQFLVLTSYEYEKEQKEKERKQIFEKAFPNIIFTPECNNMVWNKEQVSLKHNVYINQNGVAMLSLNDFIDIVDKLNQINGIDKIILKESEKGYAVARGMYVCGISLYDFSFNQNGVIRKDITIENQNDIYYISLRAVAEIFDCDIVWNDDSKNISMGVNI